MQTLLALIAPLVSVTEEAAATAVLGDVLILGVDVVEDISLDRALASWEEIEADNILLVEATSGLVLLSVAKAVVEVDSFAEEVDIVVTTEVTPDGSLIVNLSEIFPESPRTDDFIGIVSSFITGLRWRERTRNDIIRSGLDIRDNNVYRPTSDIESFSKGIVEGIA